MKAGFWNFSTTIINQVRNFIVSLVLARLLTPEDFGLVGMATVFVGVVEAFVDFGFGASIVQAKDVSRRQLSTVFYINLLMGTLFAVIMFLSSNLIADFFKDNRLSIIVKVLSPTFIVKALQVMPDVLFKKALDYKTPFSISVITGILAGIIGIVLAIMGYGVWALIYSQISGWIISLILQYWKTKWWPLMCFKINEIKELWSFGYKFSLSIMIDQIFTRLNTILIGKFFNASLLGLYYRACSLNGLVIQYSFSSFANVLFPTFCKYQDDIPMLRHNVVRIVQVVSFLTFLFSGLMIVCAFDIIVLLYGDEWIGAVEFFKILGLFSITLTIPTILVNALMAIGRTDLNLKIELIKKGLLVLSIPIGIHYGVYGYIWAVSIGALAGLPFNMWALKYINLSIWVQLKSIAVYFVPFVILVIVDNVFFDETLFNNSLLSLIVKASVYISIYIAYNKLLHTQGLSSAISIAKPMVDKLYKFVR